MSVLTDLEHPANPMNIGTFKQDPQDKMIKNDKKYHKFGCAFIKMRSWRVEKN